MRSNRPREPRQRRVPPLGRQPTGADRRDVGLGHAYLQREHRVERRGPRAAVRDGVGQQHLDPGLAERARVHVAEQADEALDQLGRVGHARREVRHDAERLLQRLEHGTRLRRGRGERVDGEHGHGDSWVIDAPST